MPDTMTETEAFDLMEKWIDIIRTARRYSEHFVTYGGWDFDTSGNYGESHA